MPSQHVDDAPDFSRDAPCRGGEKKGRVPHHEGVRHPPERPALEGR